MSQVAPGFSLGQYRIVEQIGKGGMATVYKAHQERLDRFVAIKVLPAFYAEDATFVERFEQEAQLIARLRHPNILTVFDFGQQENIIYIVSEYVGGGTLKDKIGAPLPYDYVNFITVQVASALDYAHGQGILHRDVKPSNILLTLEGTPVLSDFGLARILERSERLTRTAVALGTPEYMAPEQALGQEVDRRADVYAFGAVLYEMLVGTVPYSGDTPVSTILAHVNQPLPPPRSRNPALSEAVETILVKALAKKPDERFQTAGELAQAFQQATEGKVTVSLPTSTTLAPPVVVPPAPPRAPGTGISRPVPPPEAVAKRRPKLYLYVAVIVVLLVALGVGGMRFLARAGGPPAISTGIKVKLVLSEGTPVDKLSVDLYTPEAFGKGLYPIDTKVTDDNGIAIFPVNPGDYVVGFNLMNWPPQLVYPAEPTLVHVVSGEMVEKVIQLQRQK